MIRLFFLCDSKFFWRRYSAHTVRLLELSIYRTNMSKSFKQNKQRHEMFELRELAMKSTSKKVSVRDIECPK